MQIRSKYKSVCVYAHARAEFETQCTSMQSHANQCKSTQTDANQLELAVLLHTLAAAVACVGSLLSNMLDLCVYAWVTKQHTYIIHI